MRRSELLALTWDSIDFDKSTIFIKRAVTYTPDRGCVYKSTKNKNKRLIEVTSEALDILRLVKEKQDKIIEDAKTDKDAPQYTDNNLVAGTMDS